MSERASSAAYIIASPTETERRALSMDFAAGLICISTGAKPCRSCAPCRKVYESGHPDVVWLSSYEADGKRKNISVSQAREIIRDSSILPNEAAVKVYIIDNAEDMNTQAQNAMLKLLEEPPPSVCIILCVSNPSALLPTVLSRCGIIRSREELHQSEANPDAAKYLDLVISGDVLGMIRFAAEGESMDLNTLGAFIDALRTEQLSRTIRGDDRGLPLLPILDQLRSSVDLNVGVKHIWGVLMSAQI
jgi:hypothetical protein